MTVLPGDIEKIRADPKKVAALIGKFEHLETALNADLFERQTEIKTSITALISRRHHFQVGPPGVAKSLLVRRLVARIDGLHDDALFQWLLTKYTTPEEIFGPPSLKALENDIYRRNTARKLPVASFAFLDELFKANSSILNALLTIMNERLFFNNTDDASVPLMCVFGASNEMPMGEELNAMFDRLHFRHEIRAVQDGGNFSRMLAAHWADNPEPSLHLDEVIAAQLLVDTVEVPSDLRDQLTLLRENLRREGIEPTDRRFVECMAIIRATAFLHGRFVAEIDDLYQLRHVLWSRTEDQKVVRQEVLSLSNPIDKEASDLLDEIEVLGSQVQEAIDTQEDGKALAKQAVEIHGKLKKAKGELEELRARALATGRKSEILDVLSERFVTIGKTLMNDCFGVEKPVG